MIKIRCALEIVVWIGKGLDNTEIPTKLTVELGILNYRLKTPERYRCTT